MNQLVWKFVIFLVSRRGLSQNMRSSHDHWGQSLRESTANIWLVVSNMNFMTSISYMIFMGCQPSHWRTHIFQDRSNHQPVVYYPLFQPLVECNGGWWFGSFISAMELDYTCIIALCTDREDWSSWSIYFVARSCALTFTICIQTSMVLPCSTTYTTQLEKR